MVLKKFSLKFVMLKWLTCLLVTNSKIKLFFCLFIFVIVVRYTKLNLLPQQLKTNYCIFRIFIWCLNLLYIRKLYLKMKKTSNNLRSTSSPRSTSFCTRLNLVLAPTVYPQLVTNQVAKCFLFFITSSKLVFFSFTSDAILYMVL